jgi:hypothetical protein
VKKAKAKKKDKQVISSTNRMCRSVSVTFFNLIFLSFMVNNNIVMMSIAAAAAAAVVLTLTDSETSPVAPFQILYHLCSYRTWQMPPETPRDLRHPICQTVVKEKANEREREIERVKKKTNKVC